jgi:hypothetical protein
MKKRDAEKLKREYEGKNNPFGWKYSDYTIKEKWESNRDMVLAKLVLLEKKPPFKHLLDSLDKAIQEPLYIKQESQYYQAPYERTSKTKIQDVLVVNPIYRVVPKKRKPVGNELVDSEEMTVEITAIIQEEARKNGIEADVLSTYNLKEGDGEIIEDVYVLKRAIYDYASGQRWDFISPLQNELYAVMQKYDQRYLDFTTVVREHGYSLANRQLGSCICYTFVGYPIGIAVMLTKAWTRTVHSLVLDTDSMKVIFNESEEFKDKSEKKAQNYLKYKYKNLSGN